MDTLSIDIETFSYQDLTKCGVSRYVEDPGFKILIVAFSCNSGPIKVFHFCDDLDDFFSYENIGFRKEFESRLFDSKVRKIAFNAPFEMPCLAKQYSRPMPADEWSCSMARAALHGLPLGLNAAAISLDVDARKDAAGNKLLQYFSIPTSERKRNMPSTDPEGFKAYMKYCVQDVYVEQQIAAKLDAIGVIIPASERSLWILDREINDRGVPIDVELAQAAVKMDTKVKDRLMAEAEQLGVANVRSPKQVKDWLKLTTDRDIHSLSKGMLDELKQLFPNQAHVRRMLEIRSQTSKSSVAKYESLLNYICSDGCAHDMFQFAGASQTGRWAGRGPQPHNLTKNVLGVDALATAIKAVKAGRGDILEMTYGSIPLVLSQLCRTAFAAPNGYLFAPSDYAAIEARVLAWLAGEEWRLEVFRTHGKIYETSASMMYGIPLEQITKGSTYRVKGKLSELGLGYQGARGALERIAQTALTEALLKYELLGEHPVRLTGETPIEAIKRALYLSEEDLIQIPPAWRAASPAIPRLWRCLNECAMKVTRDRGGIARYNGLEFSFRQGSLIMTLPSGRSLFYHKAQIGQGDYGDNLVFWGVNQSKNRWEKYETYGGSLTENAVQAISRDILADAMLTMNAQIPEYPIVMHVHDEIMPLVPEKETERAGKEIKRIMETPPKWAPGLPLKVETSFLKFYRKE
jgi:DNA polymerase